MGRPEPRSRAPRPPPRIKPPPKLPPSAPNGRPGALLEGVREAPHQAGGRRGDPRPRRRDRGEPARRCDAGLSLLGALGSRSPPPPPRPSRGPSRPLPRVPSCLEVASALTRILLKGRGYARAGAEFGDAAAELSCPAAKYTFSPLTLAALSRRERAVFAGAQSTARAHLTRDRAAARARPLAPPRLQGRRGQGRLAPY
jgi:hypothetical protein